MTIITAILSILCFAGIAFTDYTTGLLLLIASCSLLAYSMTHTKEDTK